MSLFDADCRPNQVAGKTPETMARQDALLRLATTLQARRQDQNKKLVDKLENLSDNRAANYAGDSADLAFEAGSDETVSRLVELGDRELLQIDRAMARWNQGTYGICESCKEPIPLARLNALPYASFCINCVREIEKHQGGPGRPNAGSWGKISDAQAPMQDRRLKLSELEMDLSGSRRG
jgi:DnaK suppressor protein